jgi:general stress protein YciG
MPKKDPHAAAMGRKGGKARMKDLSAEERKQLARDAGRASGEARRAKAKQRKKEEK